MTTMTHGPSTDTPAGDTRASGGMAARLFVPAFWGTLAIVAMWLAVLFDGIYGGNIISTGTDGSVTNIPSAVVLGLFAVIGTSSVAKRTFGRRDAE